MPKRVCSERSDACFDRGIVEAAPVPRVRVALRELERYTQARIGNVHAPETTGKFIAATFEHDTARPVDGSRRRSFIPMP